MLFRRRIKPAAGRLRLVVICRNTSAALLARQKSRGSMLFRSMRDRSMVSRWHSRRVVTAHNHRVAIRSDHHLTRHVYNTQPCLARTCFTAGSGPTVTPSVSSGRSSVLPAWIQWQWDEIIHRPLVVSSNTTNWYLHVAMKSTISEVSATIGLYIVRQYIYIRIVYIMLAGNIRQCSSARYISLYRIVSGHWHYGNICW